MISKSNLIRNRIQVNKGCYILYLLKDKEIVYIGRINKNIPNLYGHNDKEFDSYYVYEVSEELHSEILVEEIIKYCPQYNNPQLPPNGRYMTKGMMKSNFDITGVEINRLIKKNKVTPVYQDYYDIRDIFRD